MIRAQKFQQDDIGKTIKSTKSRLKWILEIQGENNILEFFISHLSGKKKITLNGKKVIYNDSSHQKNFNHVFKVLDQHFRIRECGKNYELLINNQTFQQLQNDEKERQQLEQIQEMKKQQKKINQQKLMSDNNKLQKDMFEYYYQKKLQQEQEKNQEQPVDQQKLWQDINQKFNQNEYQPNKLKYNMSNDDENINYNSSCKKVQTQEKKDDDDFESILALSGDKFQKIRRQTTREIKTYYPEFTRYFEKQTLITYNDLDSFYMFNNVYSKNYNKNMPQAQSYRDSKNVIEQKEKQQYFRHSHNIQKQVFDNFGNNFQSQKIEKKYQNQENNQFHSVSQFRNTWGDESLGNNKNLTPVNNQNIYNINLTNKIQLNQNGQNTSNNKINFLDSNNKSTKYNLNSSNCQIYSKYKKQSDEFDIQMFLSKENSNYSQGGENNVESQFISNKWVKKQSSDILDFEQGYQVPDINKIDSEIINSNQKIVFNNSNDNGTKNQKQTQINSQQYFIKIN